MALPDLEIGDEEIEVARWMQESGRRKANPKLLEALAAEPAAAAPVLTKARRHITQPAALCLLGLTAASFLIYHFADVQLKIITMRSLLVFIG